MALEVKFVDSFFPRYQRNNKKCGLKNLRCFPQCLKAGHTGTGFCGRPISCVVHGVEIPEPNVMLRAWGEFMEVDSDDQFRSGTTIPLNDALCKERSKEEPKLPWIRGDVSLGRVNDGMTIVFNKQLLGWSYSWTSNKHTCDAFHYFKIFLFQQHRDSEELVFLGSVSSPRFQIFSRRRQKVFEADVPTKLEQSEENDLGGKNISVSQPAAKRTRSDDGNTSRDVAPRKRQPTKVPAAPVPFNLMHCATKDVEGLDSILKERSEEMIHNRCLDRLFLYFFHHSIYPNQSTNQQQHSLSLTIPESAPAGSQCGDDKWTMQTEEGSPYAEQEVSGFDAHVFPGFHDSLLDLLMFDEDYPQVQAPTTGASRDDQTQSPASQIQTILVEKGGMQLEEAKRVLNNINIVSQTFIRLSHNAAGFKEIVKKYSSPTGLQRLKSIIQSEKEDTNFEWTIEREDETFDEIHPENNVENSIFAEVRNEFRKIVRQSLEVNQMSIAESVNAMEILAQSGWLQPSPFTPPLMKLAMMIHLQMYGNLDKLGEQDYGAREGRFVNEEQQRIYARDMLIVKRAMFRRQISTSIIQSQRVKRFAGLYHVIVHPRWDINGTWMKVDPQATGGKDSATEGMIASSKILGMPVGNFVVSLFEAMFRQVEIRINSKALIFKGQQVLLSSSEFCVPLTGNAQTFVFESPIPMKVFTEEHLVTGWLDEDHDGFACIYVVVGSKFPIHSPLNNPCLDPDPNCELQNQIRDFLGRWNSKAEEAVTRVVKKIRIPNTSGEKDYFTLEHYSFLFPSAASAPDLNNRSQIAQFLKTYSRNNQNASLLFLSYEERFVRNYLDSSDTAFVCEML